MKKRVIINGYCPTLEAEHSISINYIPLPPKVNQPTTYLKDRMECSLASYDSSACPIAEDCPIYKEAANFKF